MVLDMPTLVFYLPLWTIIVRSGSIRVGANTIIVTPTSELDDNAANTALLHADLANYVGKIDFPAMEDLGAKEDVKEKTSETQGSL